MPTYDYRCDACGHTFELFQGMRDSLKRTCPECKARKLKRLIGTGAAILIGGRSSSPEPSSQSNQDSQSEGSTSTSSSESDTSKATTTEKKMSGSTSTPTHEAREHRGIGNLVDAAKRTRAESSSKKNSPQSNASKPSGSAKSEKKPTKKTPKPSKSTSTASQKKSPKSGGSRSPRTGK